MAVAAMLWVAAGGAGTAQEAGSPFGSFKHDSTQPIEITSDSLSVNQAEQVATFSGAVVAGQGTLRLTATEMRIFYDGDPAATPGGAATPDEGNPQTGNPQTGSIRLMRATGNVILTNGAEAAQGDWAEYDVSKGVITMGGAVILTQGANAISGTSLWIDLNAGVGEIKGRVRTIFQPAATGESN